ncbi:MAG: universal stress protein [Burkholderiales bacterium]|nr:universal stress protein [Burkholderiales bacterium]
MTVCSSACSSSSVGASEAGQKALLGSVDMAQYSDAEIALVAVMPPSVPMIAVDGAVYDAEHDVQLKRDYAAILADGLKRLAEAGRPARGEILFGNAVEQIAGYAKKMNAELIVLGHKHLDSWAARWWRGSTSPALIEHAPCSVLVMITR